MNDLPLNHPLLSAEEERALALAAQAGDIDARNTLVLHNLRLVLKCARKFRPVNPAVDHDDLFQFGVEELMRLIETYDPSRTRFLTYVYPFLMIGMYRRTLTAGTIYVPLTAARTQVMEAQIEAGRRVRYLEDEIGEGWSLADVLSAPDDTEAMALTRAELSRVRDSLQHESARRVFDLLAAGHNQASAAREAGCGASTPGALIALLRDRFGGAA